MQFLILRVVLQAKYYSGARGCWDIAQDQVDTLIPTIIRYKIDGRSDNSFKNEFLDGIVKANPAQ